MEKQVSINFGILLSAVGFFVFFLNSYNHYLNTGIISYQNNLNLFTLIISIIVLTTSFFKIGIYIQIFFLSCTALITLHEDPTQGISILQFILVFLLAKKHGLLQYHLIKKVIGFSIVILTTLTLSVTSYRHTFLKLAPTILFYAFFVFSVFLILKNEIFKYISNEKRLRDQIKTLKSNLDKATSDLEDIRNDYVDPIECGLTSKELILLKTICIYRETNIDLGIRLGKSPHTIKAQLAKIMIKIGADNRYQLVDLCKNFFEIYDNTEQEVTEEVTNPV